MREEEWTGEEMWDNLLKFILCLRVPVLLLLCIYLLITGFRSVYGQEYEELVS